MPAMAGKDTRTRYQGVFARHQKHCATERGGRCRCRPSYYGVVYDPTFKRHIKTKRMPTADAARSARADLIAMVERGRGSRLRQPPPRRGPRAIRGSRTGRQGAEQARPPLQAKGHRRHRRGSTSPLEPALGTKRLTHIRRGDLQAIVDELAPSLSGSRVRSIANAVRSLYRWAQDRDLADHDPAALVRLPAMDASTDRAGGFAGGVRSAARRTTGRHRAPLRTGRLRNGSAGADHPPPLARGRPRRRRDRVGRGMGSTQVRRVASRSADRRASACRFSSGATWRRVGRSDGLVCPSHTPWAPSGCSTVAGLRHERVSIGRQAKLQPITLQEARHTAATWLDAAGVRPKVASVHDGPRHAGASARSRDDHARALHTRTP